MEYQKIINFLNNTPNQASKGTYYPNSQIKFKTSMFKSNLCDYSNTYILVKGTITVPITVV